VSTRTLNRAVIIGNVGEEPKLNHTSNGSPVCIFRVATNRTWSPRDSHQTHESTQWHQVVAFGKFAEVCHKILHKSQKIYVDGRLKSTEFEYDDGSTITKVETVAQKMIVLDDLHQEAHYSDEYDQFNEPSDSPTSTIPDY
jgi:single-strand DNA-binding protein